MKKQFIKKLLAITGLLSISTISIYSQTQTENYIQSKTCLNGDCTQKSEMITYFDGLGRAKQIINVKATTTGKDLVTPITYDIFGRQTKDILPVPIATQNSSIHSGITNENTANSYYGVSNAYAEKEIESSPLDRVLQQGQAGDVWKLGSGHTTKYKYESNAGNEVKQFVTNTSINTGGSVSNTVTSIALATGSGFHNAGTLYKNTVTDEDGNPVTQFENARGQTLLIRKNDGTQNIDTYYVYNEYNQKAFVIPSKAVQQIEQNNNVISQSILDELCYQYRYDGKDREVEKKLPGKGWEYTVYDKADRPILSQDINLRAQGKWMITKYDQLGRVAYTGLLTGAEERIVYQYMINNMIITETPTTSGFNKNGIMVYYTDNYFTGAMSAVLTVNYYDSYPRDTKEFPPSKILDQFVINADATANGGISTSGMPTASYVKNIEDDNWTKTYFYYDTKGRKVGEKSWNHLGGYTKKDFKIDFSGMVEESYTWHLKSPSDTEVKIKERFVYDNQKRIIKQYHQVNTNPEELLAENTYNEIGQLVNKKTGNTTGTPLQSVDLSYNIRGWLTKVNDPSSLNGKLFAYEIKYQNPTYSNVSAGKYNGNISEIDWASADNGKFRRYNYQYDGLDRLKNGIYSEPTATVPQNNYYNETLTYDVNGNIQNLKRNRFIENLGVELMDDLGYTYTGNRLNKVDDTSGNYGGYPSSSGNPITYDNNGNMTSHVDKGMLQIDYNYLNLPNYIKFDKQYVSHDWQNTYNVNTRYLYSAVGSKLRKVYTYGSGRTNVETESSTDYLDGFQYSDNELNFVPTSEGYYDFIENKYIYNYTDQVGNIRLAYYKDVSGNVKIDRTNHYYPFGLEFGGELSNSNSITPNYTYSSNGKEKQQETGWSDFGGRMYGSDLGRWLSPDPLSEEFGGWSPYNYVLNNPLRFVDPDGNAPVDVLGEGDGCCGNFFKGIKEGFTGRIQGIKNFVSDPGKTTQNVINNYTWSDYGESVANSLTMGVYGTTKTVNKAIQGDTRSAGQDVGGAAFDVAVASVTAGVAKGLKGKAPAIVPEATVAAESKPYAKNRPSYAKGQVEAVWENAKKKNGKVFDPNTGEELKWDKSVKPRSWDMGHKKGSEYKKLHQDYMSGKISKEKFLQEYKDPKNYRPESRNANRSRKYEQK